MLCSGNSLTINIPVLNVARAQANPTTHPNTLPTTHSSPLHQSTLRHRSKKKGPTIGTENQAWSSFSVFLKNCDSGNTYSFPFTLLFESSLSGQGLFASDSGLYLSHSNGILLLKFSHSENKLK